MYKLEGGNGVEKEVDPLDLDGGRLARVIGFELIRDGARPIVRLDRGQEKRERHRRRGALHLYPYVPSYRAVRRCRGRIQVVEREAVSPPLLVSWRQSLRGGGRNL